MIGSLGDFYLGDPSIRDVRELRLKMNSRCLWELGKEMSGYFCGCGVSLFVSRFTRDGGVALFILFHHSHGVALPEYH